MAKIFEEEEGGKEVGGRETGAKKKKKNRWNLKFNKQGKNTT